MKMFTLFLICMSFLCLTVASCSPSQKSISVETVKKVFYTCSMHPQVRSENKNDKCPICGMSLVLLESSPENNKDDVEVLTINPTITGMIGLKRGTVERKELYKSIEVAGRVAFDPELFTAQNEYIEALRQEQTMRSSPLAEARHSAQKMVESARLRLKILGLSDEQIKKMNAESVVSLLPQKGDRLWVYAEVYEMDLPYVRPQLTALVTSMNFHGQKMKGEVVAVDRVINANTRTAKVRILLHAGVDLRLESFVEVSILSPLGKQLVVPREALFDTGKNTYVFVVNEEQKVLQREVVVGAYAGEEIAIAEGVSEGEEIIVSGNFLLDSESRLKKIRSGDNNEHHH